MYIVKMFVTAPSICISVNCINFSLKLIMLIVDKTVALYKTLQSFSSDVVLQM